MRWCNLSHGKDSSNGHALKIRLAMPSQLLALSKMLVRSRFATFVFLAAQASPVVLLGLRFRINRPLIGLGWAQRPSGSPPNRGTEIKTHAGSGAYAFCSSTVAIPRRQSLVAAASSTTREGATTSRSCPSFEQQSKNASCETQIFRSSKQRLKEHR